LTNTDKVVDVLHLGIQLFDIDSVSLDASDSKTDQVHAGRGQGQKIEVGELEQFSNIGSHFACRIDQAA